MTQQSNPEVDLRQKLEDIIQAAFTDEAIDSLKKKVDDICYKIQDDLEYRLKTDTAYNLASWVQSISESAIKAMLEGNDDAMRKYLQCREGGWTGRDRDHPVIRGRLFETGAIELRKKVVDAHSELLKTERILDLEDQVRSLVQQVQKLEAANENLVRRLNDATGA